MKKIMLLAGLTLGLFAGFKTEAQVRVNVQIGAPVVQQNWYGADDDYYYMPDQGVYYNVRRRVYVYPQGGSWVYANRLPARYGNVVYNRGRYYRIRERAPFNRNDFYRQRCAQSYNGNRGNIARDYHERNFNNGPQWDRNGNNIPDNRERAYGNGNRYNNR